MIAAPTSLEVVQQLYDAFVRGDATAIMALLADDLEWHEAENFMLSDRNPYRTPLAVAEGVCPPRRRCSRL
jgi:ketosteroid isomerase-like protein